MSRSGRIASIPDMERSTLVLTFAPAGTFFDEDRDAMLAMAMSARPTRVTLNVSGRSYYADARDIRLVRDDDDALVFFVRLNRPGAPAAAPPATRQPRRRR